MCISKHLFLVEKLMTIAIESIKIKLSSETVSRNTHFMTFLIDWFSMNRSFAILREPKMVREWNMIL